MEGLCLKDSIDKDEKIPMVSFDDVVFCYDEHIPKILLDRVNPLYGYDYKPVK